MSHKMKTLPNVSVAVVALFWTGAVFSQQGRRPSLPPLEGVFRLLLTQSVQKELGIDKDAKKIAEIQTLAEPIPNAVKQALVELGMEGRAKAKEVTEEVYNKYETELKKLLTPEQFTRLKQIKWQETAFEVDSLLFDPDLIKALEVTKEQQELFQSFQREYREKLRQDRRNGPKFRADRDTQVRGSLSESQKQKFTDLKGEVFDFGKPAKSDQ